ncbi:MAG: fatty acid desaturase [Rhizobiaceae bacterium]
MSQIDHRVIIAGLSAADRADLTGREDGPALVRLAVHGGLIVALGAAIALGVPLWWLLILPQGILIVFLFTLLHEAVHETVFKTGFLNRAAALVSGFLVFIPPVWFRYFHFAHHRHTHDPERDPELASPKPATLWQYAGYLSGVLFWRSMATVLIVNALGRGGDAYVPDKARGRVVSEARRFLAAYMALAAISAAAGSALLFWVWVLPALIGQPFLRAYLLAEHALCPHVANMLENTRTTFTNRIIRFIAWNMPYHAEHHAYPAVPFHKLPRFHDHVRAHLAVTENGYVRFHRRMLASLE